MKKVFPLLLVFSLYFSAGHADPNVNIVGALITNIGDMSILMLSLQL